MYSIVTFYQNVYSEHTVYVVLFNVLCEDVCNPSDIKSVKTILTMIASFIVLLFNVYKH